MSDTSAPASPGPDTPISTTTERDELLAKKFQQAKDQNDQEYALALAAAVANYELVLELKPDDDRRRAARRDRARASTTTPARGWRASRDRGRAALARDRERLRRRRRPHLGDAPLPRAVDLRRAWHAIADQGHTASCVGWAVADSRAALAPGRGRPARARRAALRPLRVDGGEGDRPARGRTRRRSWRQDGTSLKAGLDVVRKFGVALESELPWNGGARRRLARGLQRVGAGGAGSWPTSTSATTACRPRRALPEWRKLAAPERPGGRADRAGPPLRRRPARARRRSTPPRSTRQPRRRAVRLRPRPLPAALELGHGLGRAAATRG